MQIAAAEAVRTFVDSELENDFTVRLPIPLSPVHDHFLHLEPPCDRLRETFGAGASEEVCVARNLVLKLLGEVACPDDVALVRRHFGD